MAYERQKLKNELKINLNYGEIGGKIKIILRRACLPDVAAMYDLHLNNLSASAGRPKKCRWGYPASVLLY